MAESVRKGDPVVVTGRLRTEVWQAEKGPQPGFVIEADSVGHDLAWGASSFRRRVHRADGSIDGGEHREAGAGAAVERSEAGDAMPEDPWATDGGAPEPDDADLVRTP